MLESQVELLPLSEWVRAIDRQHFWPMTQGGVLTSRAQTMPKVNSRFSSHALESANDTPTDQRERSGNAENAAV